MINIQKGKVDSSVIIGAAVVFAVIGAAIFGVYYFAFVVPSRNELEDSKSSALNSLDSTLGSVNTSKAESKTIDYKAQIKEADSKSEVTTIMQEVSSLYELESTREQLLNTAKNATHGSFYTLDSLYENLQSEIKSMTTLTELQNFEESRTISKQATAEWKELLSGVLGGITENEVVMSKVNTPLYWEYMSKSNAEDLVQSKTWEELKKLDFDSSGSYAIPVLDTYERAPTIEPGSTVDVAVYDYESENFKLIGGSTTVLNVIYSKDSLGSVEWYVTDGDQSNSYSTNVWEAIKAATAGDSDAANIQWTDYARDVIQNGQEAGVGNYGLQALYVVKVSTQDQAEALTYYEQYSTETKDVILLPHTE